MLDHLVASHFRLLHLWRQQFVGYFGCVEPASKEGMKAILARKVPFGILPGGSLPVNPSPSLKAVGGCRVLLMLV